MIGSNIFLFIILSISTIEADDCQYSTPDGIIDLRTFGYKDRPKYTHVADTGKKTIQYSFNGCFPYATKDSCQKAAACATDIPSKEDNLIARQENRAFIYNQGLTTITYTNGGDITLRVFMVCKSIETIQASYVNDQNYVFHIESKCACPGNCTYTPDNEPKSGLSGGAIFLIILFSVVAAYLIFSIIFLRFIKHEQGVNLIPNRVIWLQLGQNSMKGARFSLQKLRGQRAYENI